MGEAAKARVSELYAKSRAREFGLAEAEFAAILEQLAAQGGPGGASFRGEEFFAHPHLEDLVLARACVAGSEAAWQAFMLRFRERLYDVARQITREDSSGRELADSLYAGLYGTETREGRRISKLASYSGRGSLEGWLRTVVAQEFVNGYRRQRRLVAFDEDLEGPPSPASAPEGAAAPADARLDQAVDRVLRSLVPEERFILASYFLDQRTLAEIARALSVHESTVCRKVEKLSKGIRKQVLKQLARRGMSRREAEEALSADVRDLTVDVRASLAQDSIPNAFSSRGAKASEGS